MKIIPNGIYFENVEQLLSEGKSVELRIYGGSMRPYLRGDGSEAIVASSFSSDELKRGTIVIFRYRGKYICHRIIERNGEQLVIQGDGVIKNQEHAMVTDVIGVVRTIIRRNGKLTSTQSKAAQRYWRLWFCLSPVRKYLLLPVRVVSFVKIRWRNVFPKTKHTVCIRNPERH